MGFSSSLVLGHLIDPFNREAHAANYEKFPGIMSLIISSLTFSLISISCINICECWIISFDYLLLKVFSPLYLLIFLFQFTVHYLLTLLLNFTCDAPRLN